MRSRKPWLAAGCIVIVTVGVGVGLGVVFSSRRSDTSSKATTGTSDSVPTVSPSSQILESTEQPTILSTLRPTIAPTSFPTVRPTPTPSGLPVVSSTQSPTENSPPTQPPVNGFKGSPTLGPTRQPSYFQGTLPTPSPTVAKSNNTSPTADYAQIVRDISPSGGVELDDPNSYQSKALQWLESSAPLYQFTAERVIQRYVLACIFYATNQVQNAYTDSIYGVDVPVFSWQDTNGWLTSPNECEWKGITCDSNEMVTGINLADNVLTGTMPSETGLITTLRSLDLYNNYFYNVGDEGNNWLGELTNLEKLYIGSTSFQYDGIPPAIGKLTNLIDFDCSYSLYLGPLRGEIFENMNRLEYLYIGGNSYNSSIPKSITNLPNLRFFYSEDSDVIGDLGFMISMPQISELWIDSNPKLTGSLPTGLGNVVTLESFAVTGCGLTGPIPTELGLLTGMQQMWLYGNVLSGKIPTQLGSLSNMKRLEIQKNLLTGSMPSEICDRRAAGVVEELEADCNGEVSCPTDCCTCCGEDCIDSTDT